MDLAENVTLFGRDLTQPLPQPGPSSAGPTVSLPALRSGRVAVVMATVTAGFRREDVGAGQVPAHAYYRTPEEAAAQAQRQVRLYHRWAGDGHVRLIRSRRDLDDHLRLWARDGTPGLVLLMEGADPIVQVSDLTHWWDDGLRVIALTYGATRYGAGVTGRRGEGDGGLTEAGIELLHEMGRLGIAWDISHLAESGFWEGLQLGRLAVCASHANARAITPNPRQLSDEMIRAVADHGGVVGLVLYNRYLNPVWRRGSEIAVTLSQDLRRHAEHMARVAGWDVVGIGSDLDGGFGREATPAEIDSVADLARIGDALPESAAARVLGENWLSFLRSFLPN